MNEDNRSPKYIKSRRNLSDLEINFLQQRNALSEPNQSYAPKANCIKINRSKLPHDFFPRSESVRKKISSKRSIYEGSVPILDRRRKAESEREHVSPEKTSFFGFFQDTLREQKSYSNTISLKRKFESREEQKREKIILEPRHFTPVNKAQRLDLLDVFPARHEQVLAEVMKTSLKAKALMMSPRKEHMLRQQEIVLLDPEKEERMATDAGIITFFNAKSTSFPPINKSKNCS